MTILDQLAEHARERTRLAQKHISKEAMRQLAFSLPKGTFLFEDALKQSEMSFICECKKASPSKGLISPDFLYLDIAKQYEAAGADAISVLTEPKWFLGSDRHLQEIASAISIPCLRKDFTVDAYMIYEAKVLGASAVLLICSILTLKQLQEYLHICDSLGISALVETHDEKEIEMAIQANARIIGVNNRNLNDFSIDTENSCRLRHLIPKDILFVSESGIQNANDIAFLHQAGVNAVLIGEILMRASNKKAALSKLKTYTEAL